AVDLVRSEVVVGPEIHARGLGLDDAAYEPVTTAVRQAVLEALQDGASDTHALQQVIRRQVGRWVSNTHRRRPMIVPVVVEA
ncbi:MAG: RNase J family beta-CASP ribonuclease, partial [Actinomycetales bacterium]